MIGIGVPEPREDTLSYNAMYSEKPNLSVSCILADSWSHSSLAVVAESAISIFVVPSIKVMGSVSGFLDLVAYNMGGME